MKLNKKYIRVHCKLAFKYFTKRPSVIVTYAMTFIVIAGSSLAGFQAWKNHNYLKESTFSEWEKHQKTLIGRNIASSTPNCNNTYDLSILTTEVKKLESSFETGHIIKGNWNGINLEEIPQSQAQLLTQYGPLIGNQKSSNDFTGCTDVTCVINKVYNNNHPEIGYMIYYWYLKTGIMISLSNSLPNQKTNYPGIYNGKSFNLQEYLFTFNEVKVLYQLARSLPVTFLNIPQIKAIYKVPGNEPVDLINKSTHCSLGTSRGEILLSKDCKSSNNFAMNVTHEIARYIDLDKGRLEKVKSISASKSWLQMGGWSREDYWDKKKGMYHFNWTSVLNKNQLVSDSSWLSPSEYFAELLAHFRFKPNNFYRNTNQEIATYLLDNIFEGRTYDPKGLLKQYLNTSIKFWEQKESAIWKACFDRHISPDDQLKTKNLRDVASTINNPLFSCVESEVKDFISSSVEDIKSSNVDGCGFFSGSEYNNHTRQFYNSLRKYIRERIVQRKIEIKDFGNQVITSQEVKNEFKNNIDPSSVYINCYDSLNTQSCYENQMENLANSTVGNFSTIQGHYKERLIEELKYLYKFEDVAENTNVIVSKFLMPFSYKVQQVAQNFWEKCKINNDSYSHSLKLPLRFTGGRHFVKASLLNCISENYQENLDKIIDDDQKVKYDLNFNERKFVLRFLDQRFENTLSSFLEDQRILEVYYIISYFNNINEEAIENLTKRKTLFKNLKTMEDAENKCLNSVRDFYPKNYFYLSQKELDKTQGRSICSTLTKYPEIKRKINISIERSWENNKEQVNEWFSSEYKTQIGNCQKLYPLDSGSPNNARMVKICFEDAYNIALTEALQDWKEDDDFSYYSSKEKELVTLFTARRKDYLDKAWNGQIKPGKFHFITRWF